MRLTSINIGTERTQTRKDHVETTGIYKLPASGLVRIETSGVEGDLICDHKNHGGPDQAVYVYGGTDYAWWAQQLGSEPAPGTFGENLTISGLESADFNVGDSLHIGDVILQVTAPRIPCGTFATRMGDPQWVKKFRQAERPGLYCRVIREGVLEAGAPVRVERYAGETISIRQMYRAHYEKDLSRELIERHLRAPIAVRARADLEDKLHQAKGG
jgi:MOSC domain-containing protein YiiM